jgi:hypothetical protein
MRINNNHSLLSFPISALPSSVTHRGRANIKGGFISEGTIRRAIWLSWSGPYISNEGENIFLPESVSKKDYPSGIEIQIEGEKRTIIDISGKTVKTFVSLNKHGLPITKLQYYLNNFGNTIKGYCYVKVGAEGKIQIGNSTHIYSNHKNKQVKIEFDFGRITVREVELSGEDIKDGKTIDEFNLSIPEQYYSQKITDEELSSFTGTVQRKVHKDGSFAIAQHDLRLNKKYANQVINIHLENGEINKILDAKNQEIPLSDLIATFLYDENGAVKHIIPAEKHLTKEHLRNRHGFLAINPYLNFLHLADKNRSYPLKRGFKSAYAQIEGEFPIRIIYFHEENKMPNDKFDDESVYRRVYLNGVLVRTFAERVGKEMFQRLLMENGKITHWQIAKCGRIEIEGEKIHVGEKYKKNWAALNFFPDRIEYKICETAQHDHLLHSGTHYLKKPPLDKF